jgi:hypothetical protein
MEALQFGRGGIVEGKKAEKVRKMAIQSTRVESVGM